MQKKSTIAVALAFTLLSGFAQAGGKHNEGHGTGQKQHMDMMEDMMHSHGSEGHSSVGMPGHAADVTKTVEISMLDTMRFTPENFSVKSGETVRLFIKNEGLIPHELVIGTKEEMSEHAEMMRKMPKMQHTETNMISLKPGQISSLIWKFGKSGDVDFACLIPGHLEAGMIGKVSVN
ncbi:cupredoxin family protein [Parasalinivibrio latis]|uniref:cupredoxin domain-containing protein n=1 Tax=Parasalinivibrio latis TaxID=2952610 RepID=UPI0030DEB208